MKTFETVRIYKNGKPVQVNVKDKEKYLENKKGFKGFSEKEEKVGLKK